MAALTLKVNIMTPVIFVRAMGKTKVEVAFGRERGTAMLPEHIKADQLAIGTPLDAKITALSSGTPGHGFEAEVKDIIDRDMLELMYLIHGMYERSLTPRSEIIKGLKDELKAVIGVRRIKGKAIGYRNFSPYPDMKNLEAAVGYGELRAKLVVPWSKEKERGLKALEEAGEVILEVLAVSEDEKSASDFCALVLVNSDAGLFFFNFGLGEGIRTEKSSSIERIERIISTFYEKNEGEEEEANALKVATKESTHLYNNLLGGEYAEATEHLVKEFSPEDMAQVLYSLYRLMAVNNISQRDAAMRFLLNAVADADLGALHKLADSL